MKHSKLISILLITILLLANCSKKKGEDTAWMSLRLLSKLNLNNIVSNGSNSSSSSTTTSVTTSTSTATSPSTSISKKGSTTFVTPSRLNIISPKSSSTKSSIKEFQKASNIFGRIMQSVIGDGSNSVDYETDPVTLFVTDPVSQNLEEIDIALRTANLTGYKWLVGKRGD